MRQIQANVASVECAADFVSKPACPPPDLDDSYRRGPSVPRVIEPHVSLLVKQPRPTVSVLKYRTVVDPPSTQAVKRPGTTTPPTILKPRATVYRRKPKSIEKHGTAATTNHKPASLNRPGHYRLWQQPIPHLSSSSCVPFEAPPLRFHAPRNPISRGVSHLR